MTRKISSRAKSIFLIITISLLSFPVLSQYCIVSGKVIDHETGESIAYVNAILTSPQDSTLLLGALTNEKGNFLIEDIPGGIYTLNISFMGYEPVKMRGMQLQNGTRDIGEVALKVRSENLDEVTVQASRVPFSYSVDRKVIDARSFPTASFAIDLLENVPSLKVDYEGKLTYRGDGTFKVFINGRPVANGIEKLKQIPAGKIDKIEVITNPSAKYSSEGTAGIIQVILKRNRLPGYAISLSTRATTFGSLSSLFSVDKQSDRGSWYVRGNYSDYVSQRWSSTGVQNIIKGDELYKTDINWEKEIGGISNYFEFGFNYDITRKDFIDFSLNLNPFESENYGKTSGTITDNFFLATAMQSSENYKYQSAYNNLYRYFGAALTYQHAFKPDRSHLLSANVDFSNYLQPFEEQSIDKKEYAARTERMGFIGREHDEMVLNVNVAYKNKFSERSAIEVGADVELDHIPKVTSVSGTFNTNEEITPFPSEPPNQAVDFKQDVYSGFLTYKNNLGKFKYLMGLRTEFTDRKSNYEYDATNGHPQLVPAEKQFWDLFPSMHAVYDFSETRQLAVSYSRRIDRPDYWSLVPVSQYETPYEYYQGNGNLMPSYANAFELGYKKSWHRDFMGTELFVRNTQGVIQSYSRTDSVGMLVNTPENVGDSWSIGAELMAGADVFKWWNVNFSASLFSYRLEITLDDAIDRIKQFKIDSRLNNTFTLPRAFTLKYDLNYSSPEITAQMKRDGYLYSNAALKKGFKDNTWEMTLSFSNIFNSIKYTDLKTGSGFNTVFQSAVHNFTSFKIAYNFNNQE